jgi:hypothetical protein
MLRPFRSFLRSSSFSPYIITSPVQAFSLGRIPLPQHSFQYAATSARMSSSPLLTPVKNSTRFKNIGTPCEYIEEYLPGGFHPVHLGDLFKDDRYKVIRKLGVRCYSTVWLSVDQQQVKFLLSEYIRNRELTRYIQLPPFRGLKDSSRTQLQGYKRAQDSSPPSGLVIFR